jgi:hypothetical protein
MEVPSSNLGARLERPSEQSLSVGQQRLGHLSLDMTGNVGGHVERATGAEGAIHEQCLGV